MQSEAPKPPCSEALAAMYLFLDKELEGPDLDHVREHLDDCLPCLEAFEFEAELKTVIATRCREDMPDYLYERVRVTLKTEIAQSAVGHRAGGIPHP